MHNRDKNNFVSIDNALYTFWKPSFLFWPPIFGSPLHHPLPTMIEKHPRSFLLFFFFNREFNLGVDIAPPGSRQKEKSTLLYLDRGGGRKGWFEDCTHGVGSMTPLSLESSLADRWISRRGIRLEPVLVRSKGENTGESFEY